MLIAGSYDEAERDLAQGIPIQSSADSSLPDQYRSLLQRIFALPSLPDTLVNYYATLGGAYRYRYVELHAGGPSTACYAKYLTHLEAGRPVQAYGAFLVADFLRLRYMAREKARLLQNVTQTRAFIETKAYSEAEALIGLFRNEPQSTTFRQLERDLEKRYALLQEDINNGRRAERYELSRVEFDQSYVATLGFGLNPFFSIPNNNLKYHLLSQSVRIPFPIQEGKAVSQALIYFGGEAGMFVFPTLALGIHFYSGSLSTAGAILDGNNNERPYGVRTQYQSAGGWFRFYFDRLTGGRPYLGLKISFHRNEIQSESDQSDPNALHFDNHTQSGLSLSPAFGLDYVPSSSVPLVVSMEGSGQYSTGRTDVISAMSFHISFRAGVLF